jgi:protease-4
MPDPQPAVTPPRSPSRAAAVIFGMSLMLNLLLAVGLVAACAGLWSLAHLSDDPATSLDEHYHSGKKSASAKVAIVRIDGVLLEGLTGYAEKQIEQAAQDRNVKAVVVQINSPGGSITASDDLHRRLTRLRDGVPEKKTAAKPLVVSMASVAASGGYYIAMPAKVIYAERSTITGSIGVYASFPDVTVLADKVGVEMTYIKRGAVKASGSPFRQLTPEERAVWDDMVGHAYKQFEAVVEEGRPDLKGKLEEKVIDEPRTLTVEEKDPQSKTSKSRAVTIQYVRQLADGGMYTADEAKKFKLIDEVGYLDDAVAKAHDLAGMGEDWKAITYERPLLLSDLLAGAKVSEPAALDPGKLAGAATPRLWYLAPQSELAGVLKAAGR